MWVVNTKSCEVNYISNSVSLFTGFENFYEIKYSCMIRVILEAFGFVQGTKTVNKAYGAGSTGYFVMSF